jgi:hypothetical protein
MQITSTGRKPAAALQTSLKGLSRGFKPLAKMDFSDGRQKQG